MWRFMFVTFAFLGWSFYQLSGGLDYTPRGDSIQARAKIDHIRPIPRSVLLPVRTNVIQLSEIIQPANETVTRSALSLADLDLAKGNRVQVSLVSVSAAINTITETGTDLEKVGILTDEPKLTPAIQVSVLPDIEPEPMATEPLDIRTVSGKVVNMRGGPGTGFEKLGKLTKGTEVEVLDAPGNGWIELRVVNTGETGWMADWLLTAAAN